MAGKVYPFIGQQDTETDILNLPNAASGSFNAAGSGATITALKTATSLANTGDLAVIVNGTKYFIPIYIA